MAPKRTTMPKIILRGAAQKAYAHRAIDEAPKDAVVSVLEATRSTEQNAKLWAMLQDISRAEPLGRKHTRDVWKAIMMNACEHETQFVLGLDGNPFPMGFRSSQLSVPQMSELIEFMYWFGSEHGVAWTEKQRAGA